MRARMGFSPPILWSSARTASASDSGWIDPNLVAMTSRASMTLGVVFSLETKSSWSLALVSLKIYSYSLRMLS